MAPRTKKTSKPNVKVNSTKVTKIKKSKKNKENLNQTLMTAFLNTSTVNEKDLDEEPLRRSPRFTKLLSDNNEIERVKKNLFSVKQQNFAGLSKSPRKRKSEININSPKKIPRNDKIEKVLKVTKKVQEAKKSTSESPRRSPRINSPAKKDNTQQLPVVRKSPRKKDDDKSEKIPEAIKNGKETKKAIKSTNNKKNSARKNIPNKKDNMKQSPKVKKPRKKSANKSEKIPKAPNELKVKNSSKKPQGTTETNKNIHSTNISDEKDVTDAKSDNTNEEISLKSNKTVQTQNSKPKNTNNNRKLRKPNQYRSLLMSNERNMPTVKKILKDQKDRREFEKLKALVEQLLIEKPGELEKQTEETIDYKTCKNLTNEDINKRFKRDEKYLDEIFHSDTYRKKIETFETYDTRLNFTKDDFRICYGFNAFTGRQLLNMLELFRERYDNGDSLKWFNYYMRVLLPEYTVKIFMETYAMDLDTAIEYLKSIPCH